MVSVSHASEPRRVRQGRGQAGESQPGLETGSLWVQLLEQGFVLGPGPRVTGVTRSGKQTPRASGDPPSQERGVRLPRGRQGRRRRTWWGRPGAR